MVGRLSRVVGYVTAQWRELVNFTAGAWLGSYLRRKRNGLFFRLPVSLRRSLYRGGMHECPVCGETVRRFLSGGVPLRASVFCPICRSLERHRLAWIYLQNKVNLTGNHALRLLHIAPEPALARRFSELGLVDYVTGDLSGVGVMVKLDVTELPFADGSYDAVYCSHVLEHVSRDEVAMAEMFRVLRPGGWVLIMVPIREGGTSEDPSIQTPRDRKRVFGHWDHVRYYGMNLAQKLDHVGFTVDALRAVEFATASEFQRYGLFERDVVFFGEKAGCVR